MTSDYCFQAVILAAGTSSRMGRPKQLLRVQGKSMLDHAIAAALEAGIERPVLVLGAYNREILRGLKLSQSCEIVLNSDYRNGQSSSLKAGVSKISGRYDAAVFLLCDQPLVGGKLIAAMMTSFMKTKPDVLYPVYRNRRGNPVIISKSLFPRLMDITGDRGARFLFTDSSLNIMACQVNDRAVVMDIDTLEDYESISGKND